jgi:anaerobic selenocysteine-containing dehydrogenase
MWYCYQPVYSNGDCQANIDTLKDESILPFTVAVSPFYDESSSLADMILPDATYLERWDWEDMVSPNQIPEYYIRQPIVPPMGEARNFADVCCDLAERMGFPLGVASMEQFVQQSCEMTPAVKNAGGFDYMKANGVYHDPDAAPAFFSYSREILPDKLSAEGVILDETTQVYWNWKKTKAKSREEALEKGYAHTKSGYKGYVGQLIGAKVYRGFPPDKVNKTGFFELYSEIMDGFPPDKVNKTGFFELYSEIMEDKGFNPMPTFYPIPEHVEMKPDELILTTYKVNVQSPETAAQRGIVDEDLITVRSEVGEITTKARVTPAVVPGVISISNHCGHWSYGRYASGNASPADIGAGTPDPDAARIWWEGRKGVHPNWIIANKGDPISGQMLWNDTVVTVEKAVLA